MSATSPFHWRHRIALREVDAFGITWYGNYLQFCDEAVNQLLRAFDLAPSTYVSRGFIVVVVDAHCRYVKPARLDEEIDVGVRLEAGKAARLTFHCTVTRVADGELLARAETTLVMLRPGGELIYLVPEPVAALLTRLLTAQANEGTGETT